MVSIKHPLNYGPNFSRLRFCDAMLGTKNDKRCLSVQRVIFAAVSKKFEKWFEGNLNMIETLEIPDFKFENLETIVNFIYTGEVTFASDGDDAYKNFCVGLVLLKINLGDIDTIVQSQEDVDMKPPIIPVKSEFFEMDTDCDVKPDIIVNEVQVPDVTESNSLVLTEVLDCRPKKNIQPSSAASTDVLNTGQDVNQVQVLGNEVTESGDSGHIQQELKDGVNSPGSDCDFQFKGMETIEIDHVQARPRREGLFCSLSKIDRDKLKNKPSSERKRILENYRKTKPAAGLGCTHRPRGCMESFTEKSELHKHAKKCIYRPNTSFTCQHSGCSKRYYYKEDYEKHLVKYHVPTSDVTIEDVSDYSDKNEPFDLDEPASKRTFAKT